MVTPHHFPYQTLGQCVEDHGTLEPVAAISEPTHSERAENFDESVPTEETARVHRCTISTSPSPAKTSRGESRRKIHMDVRLVVRVSSESKDLVTTRAEILGMDRSKYVRYLIEHALKNVPEGVLPTGPTDEAMNPIADDLMIASPSSKQKKKRLRSGYLPDYPDSAWVGRDIDLNTSYPPGFDMAVFYSVLNMSMVRCRNLLAENAREFRRLRAAMELSPTRQHGGFSTVQPSLETLYAVEARLHSIERILDDAMRTARGEMPVLLDPDFLVAYSQLPTELAPEMAECLRHRMEAMPEPQRSRLDSDQRGFFDPQDWIASAASDGGRASC